MVIPNIHIYSDIFEAIFSSSNKGMCMGMGVEYDRK